MCWLRKFPFDNWNTVLCFLYRLFLNQDCKGNPAEYRSVATDKCIDMGGFYAKYDCTGGMCLSCILSFCCMLLKQIYLAS